MRYDLVTCTRAWANRGKIPLPPRPPKTKLSLAAPPVPEVQRQRHNVPSAVQFINACRTATPEVMDVLMTGVRLFRAKFNDGKFDLDLYRAVIKVGELLIDRGYGKSPALVVTASMDGPGEAGVLERRSPEQLALLMAGLADTPPTPPKDVTAVDVPPGETAPQPVDDLRAGW